MFPGSENWFYVDHRDVAFLQSGRYPRHAPGSDVDLPFWGTGRADWQGFNPNGYTFRTIPSSHRPRALDPPQGFFMSWNNKEAPGWRKGAAEWDGGPIQHALILQQRLFDEVNRGGGKTDLTGLTRSVNMTATTDLREKEDYPLMRRVIGTASAVLCPSRHAAARIQELYGRSRLTIAVPGVRPAAPAAGSSPPRLLCVGALTPTKNQLGLLAALGELADLPWTAALVGSTESSVGYAASVAGAAARLGGRVRLTGVLSGADLEREWVAADLLVLPSRVETYGMVVAEALAHGIPAVVTAGTGAEEALGSATEDGLPGCAVPAAELAQHLRPWLTDPKLRARWRRAAGRRRQCQPSWEQTAAAVLAALPGGGEPGGREVEVEANVLAEDVPANGNA